MNNRPNDLIILQSKEDILHKYIFWTPKIQKNIS
jgi:hypothetical protein